MMRLAGLIERVRAYGPTRVVVRTEGGHVAEATTPDLALRCFGVVPDVVFVRRDGWTLGARQQDRDAAYRLWAGEWETEIAV